MITNKGIELMSRYLVGQVPAFVSHIAIGCGAAPLIPSEAHGNYSTKTALGFEMDRIPVNSRSVINVDGVNQMVFSAELPQASRYGITEIGIYPAEKSNANGSVDSRMLYAFGPGEEWISDISDVQAAVPLYYDRLDVDYVTTPGTEIPLDSIDIAHLGKAFFIESNNAVFSVDARVERHEQPRYLENALMIRGDLSTIDPTTSEITVDDHVQISGMNLEDLDKASQALDQIKLAFSVLNKENATGITDPARVHIIVEFLNGSTASAKMIINKTTNLNERYIVASSSLKDITTTGIFTWTAVDAIKIYVSVDHSSSFFVALDAMKFENASSTDARYGLAGYTVAKNASTGDISKAVPIIKHEDTASYIEFRFSLDRI